MLPAGKTSARLSFADLSGKPRIWIASALYEIGFSKESINRNPAAELEGGTFFRVSDSSISRLGTLFFRLPGGKSTLMAGSSELCESVCTLNSGRTVTDSDVWPAIMAAPLVQIPSGHGSQWTKSRRTPVPASQRSGRLVRRKLLRSFGYGESLELQSHTK